MSLTADVRVERDPFVLDVALAAGAGETLGVVGPNGSGKSTLLRALAGLIAPSRSRVEVDGLAWDDGAARLAPYRRNLGVVFQDLRLFPHMSATDNVAFALRGRVPRTEARARARRMLARVGVEDRAGVHPDALSGGEAQRVALARALIAGPRLLLLDEPLTALDVAARRGVRSLLGEVLGAHDGVAVLVSHDPVDVMTLADRIAVLEDGRLVQHGTADEIRLRPASAYASELVGVNVFRGWLEPIEPGVARLVTGEGDLVVAVRDAEAAGETVATLKPGDVSIHSERPAGSARNVVEGTVVSVAVGDRVRLTVAGRPPVVAELTLGSFRALGLAEGARVFASFKATEISVTAL